MGLMYSGGRGVQQNYEKAVANGHANAQYEAGLMYYYGKGTTKNTAKAAYYVEKAHTSGNKEAGKMWNDLELWKYKSK
jgi:TPR repeat protein